MKLVTVGPVPVYALQAALAEVKPTITEPVRFGLAYFPFQTNAAALFSAWRSVFRAPLVGASTAGIAFTEKGSSSTGVVLGIFAGAEVGIAKAEKLKSSSASLERAIRAAAQAQPRANAMLALVDPFSCDGESVVTAMRSALPLHIRAFGAMAGDDERFVSVKLVSDDRALTDAAIFVAMSLPKTAKMDVRHGFSAVDGAREMVVTEASDSRLISLDGQPAVDAYADELRRLHLAGQGPPTVQLMAKYSLGVTTPFGEGLLIRSPLKLLPNRELQMTSALATGNRVKVVTTTRERMLAAASWLKDRIASGAEPVNGALVFECGGRRVLLGQEFEAEIAALSPGPKVPMLGLAGYGEIAKFGGNVQGFHNITAVMVGW